MPNYQKRIVYLSNEQRQELFTNGTITVNGQTITYSDNDMYVTPQEVPYVKPANGIPASDLDPNALDSKADKNNTTITGSLSMYRKADTQIGTASAALGANGTASGIYSTAFGNTTVASGTSSFAIGTNTEANGVNSVAEGNYAITDGRNAHAAGEYTRANGRASFVRGRANVLNTASIFPEWAADTEYVQYDRVKVIVESNGETTVTLYMCTTDHTSTSTFDSSKWEDVTEYKDYADVVGNGHNGSERSNAYALDWNGNAYFKGDVYVGCNDDSTGGSVLPRVDDTAGSGDTDKVWSADKSNTEIMDLNHRADAVEIYETISTPADILTITDGADDIPIDNLTVAVEPVQDLHGYEYPWPGGGSINIIDIESSYTAGGSTFYGSEVNISAGETIYVQRVGGSNSSIYGRATDNSYITVGSITSGKTQITLSQDITAIGISSSAKSAYGSTGYPMISLVDFSSPVPFSNICPISGWTGANVTRTAGINLLNSSTWSTGYINASGVVTPDSGSHYSAIIPVEQGGYIFSGVAGKDAGNKRVHGYDSNGNWVQQLGVASNVSKGFPYTVAVTVPSGVAGIRVSCYVEDTDAHVECGNIYPITFPSEGGTVYGGTLTVNQDGSGSLVVDSAKIVFDGTQTVGLENWKANSTSVGWLYALNITPGIKYTTSGSAIPEILDDTFEVVKYAGDGGIQDKTTSCISIVTGGATWGIAMRVADTSLTTATTINAWLAQNPVTVIYKLITPTVYSLTASQIKTLLGLNHIWADTGAIQSITYSADPKLYVDRHIPEVPVQDVQVNGTSILSNGVANVPVASSSDVGAVKVGGTMQIGSSGAINFRAVGANEVKAGTSYERALTPERQHASVFYGLAKLAGADMASSSNSIGTYTDAAKSAISTMLNGAVSVSGTTPSITGLAGLRYVCGEVATLSITPPVSGIIDVVFQSGSTPTVLTVPNTVKFPDAFDPTNLDANTIYEINILDGVYGLVSSWT